MEERKVDAENANFLIKTDNIFDKLKIKKGYLISHESGEFMEQTDKNYCVSDFLECEPNCKYFKSNNRHVAFYDSEYTFISGIQNCTEFTTPYDCKYLAITLYLATDNLDYFMIYKNSMPELYIPPYKMVYSNDIKKTIVNKFVSFGDSLTYMNVWQPFVAEKLQYSHFNRGIGSSTIAYKDVKVWIDENGEYVDRPNGTNTQPDNTTEINFSMCTDDRVNTIPTYKTDLITFMGGTNDFNMSVPIGTDINPDAVNPTEFKSAVAVTIKKITTRCPRARLVCITLPVNKNSLVPNKAGHTTLDYANAMKEVCELYGIPCIDFHNLCGWNIWNVNNFLSDGVHFLDTGARRAEEVIYNGLKNIINRF